MAQRLLHIVAAALFALMVPRLMGPCGVRPLRAADVGLDVVCDAERARRRIGDDARRSAAGDGRRHGRAAAVDEQPARAAHSHCRRRRVIPHSPSSSSCSTESDLVAASFIAGGVFCRTVANVCFSFFLGLNQAARWGLGDLLRRWLTLVLVLVGFPRGRPSGRVRRVLIANLVVLGFGLARALGPPALVPRRPDEAVSRPAHPARDASSPPGTCCSRWCIASGETVVRLSTDDYVQVGFFGAAYSIYLTGAQALWQLAVSFAPFLIARVHQGDTTSAAPLASSGS